MAPNPAELIVAGVERCLGEDVGRLT